MLLIMAEAKAQTDVNEGSHLLSQLRKERIIGWSATTYASKEELLKQIELERRHELCFEGHRWFDLRRWELPIVKNETNKTLEVGDFHRLMPIPKSEMEANPVIAKQQNKGY